MRCAFKTYNLVKYEKKSKLLAELLLKFDTFLGLNIDKEEKVELPEEIIKIVEERKWEIDRYQWFALLLPVSQHIILQYLYVKYTGKLNTISRMVGFGIVLGLIGDILMFWLFERSNTRKQAEEELRKLKYQYEKEQVRYTALLEKQEEISKMRHDFQNYVLVMKSEGQV